MEVTVLCVVENKWDFYCVTFCSSLQETLMKNNNKWCFEYLSSISYWQATAIGVEYLSSISYWPTTTSDVLKTCQVFPTDKQQQVVCWIPVKYFLLTNNSKWCVEYLSSMSYWQTKTSGVLNTCQVFPTHTIQTVPSKVSDI